MEMSFKQALQAFPFIAVVHSIQTLDPVCRSGPFNSNPGSGVHESHLTHFVCGLQGAPVGRLGEDGAEAGGVGRVSRCCAVLSAVR